MNVSSQNLEYITSNSSLGLHTEEFDVDGDGIRNSVDNDAGNSLSKKSTEDTLHATDSEVFNLFFIPVNILYVMLLAFGSVNHENEGTLFQKTYKETVV